MNTKPDVNFYDKFGTFDLQVSELGQLVPVESLVEVSGAFLNAGCGGNAVCGNLLNAVGCVNAACGINTQDAACFNNIVCVMP